MRRDHNDRVTYSRRVTMTSGRRRTGPLTMQAYGATPQSRAVVLLAATLVLISGNGFVRASAGEDMSPSTTNSKQLVCSAACREITFMATASRQEISVDGSQNGFYGQCEVKVNFTSNNTEDSTTYQDRKLAVLVKFYALQLQPPQSNCSDGGVIVEIRDLPATVRGVDICNNIADSLYIWVSKPFVLHMYAYPTQNAALPRASFSAAFLAVESVNMCQIYGIPSAKLSINSELFVFAPDSKFSKLLPNGDANCFDNRELVLTASNPLSWLSITVLSAPANSSCWSLFLDGRRINNTETRSFSPGKNVSLLYTLRPETCSAKEPQRGFTIRLIAVPVLTMASVFSSTEPANSIGISAGYELIGESAVALVAGSAAAAVAVAMAVAITIASLIIHRRRRKRQGKCLTATIQQVITPVPSTWNSDSAPSVNCDQSDNPWDASSSQQQFMPSADFSTRFSVVAPPVDFDVKMVDNDLYGGVCASGDSHSKTIGSLF